MIVDRLSIEFLGLGNVRLTWTGDPELVAHVFVNGSPVLAPQSLAVAEKSVTVSVPDPFTIEVHEVAAGADVAPAAIPLARKPVVWWSARDDAAEYHVHHRPDGGTDSMIGRVLPASDAPHCEFPAPADLRKDGKAWGFFRVEAVNAQGASSARAEWPLRMAALPSRPIGLEVTGGSGVFALALETA